MFKFASLLMATSAIQLQFQPNSLVEEFNGPTGFASKEPSKEPWRPDIGRKEVRPDVWEVVNKMVDPVPLSREDEPPKKNPHYSLSRSEEYPSPDIRGPPPENAHPDVTFSSHLHDDWTH